MRIKVNDKWLDTDCATLEALVDSLNYQAGAVATAVDGNFIPRQQRPGHNLVSGMHIDIVGPMQGG
jgi:sulfur carrier protein